MSGPPIIIVKKKGKGHGGHGAAWKVAYADFVTAMMALFIVLWLLAQTDQEVKKEISEYFRTGAFSGTPSLLEGGAGSIQKGYQDESQTDRPVDDSKGLARQAEEVRAQLSTITRDDPKLKEVADLVTISVTDEGLLIEFTDTKDDLLFDLSSSELKPALARLLRALTPVLIQLRHRVRIQGHTDARRFPDNSPRNNWQLSYERADKARRILEEAGFPENLIAGVFAHGANTPLYANDPTAPGNRRLSLLAIPDNWGRAKRKAEPKPPAP